MKKRPFEIGLEQLRRIVAPFPVPVRRTFGRRSAVDSDEDATFKQNSRDRCSCRPQRVAPVETVQTTRGLANGAMKLAAPPSASDCTEGCKASGQACQTLFCSSIDDWADYAACIADCFAEEFACRAECHWNGHGFLTACEADPDGRECYFRTWGEWPPGPLS